MKQEHELKILQITSLSIAALILALSLLYGHYGISFLIVAYAIANWRIVNVSTREMFRTLGEAMTQWASNPDQGVMTMQLDEYRMVFSKVLMPDGTATLPHAEPEANCDDDEQP